MRYKIFWIIRAIFYKIFFKRIGFPSYIGKPIFLLGTMKISLGKKVRIFPMSRMEVHGKKSEIIIKDNVSIAQGFHVISGGSLIMIIVKLTSLYSIKNKLLKKLISEKIVLLV